MPYQALDPHMLTSTITTLHKRIDERFPDSDLVGVCGELVNLSERARDATDVLTRPMLALRVVSGALIALIVAGLAVTLVSLRSLGGGFTIPTFVQTLSVASTIWC